MGNCTTRQTLLQSNLGKDFSFDGYTCLAKIVDVYDGDTCRAIFKWNGQLIQWKLRLYGFNSPEIKPALNITNREIIVENAMIAKTHLSNIILGQLVRLECMKFDKYGRILAKLHVSDTNLNVNEFMLRSGYGVEYYGRL
jgi:endonuclease YncB( thermonuclease family)